MKVTGRLKGCPREGLMVRKPVYVPTPDVRDPLALTLMDAVPLPESVSEAADAESHEPPGDTLYPKVSWLPVLFWMTTVCEAVPLVPAVSETLPGVAVT